jgi:Na+/H+ antiporter NhaD/arsenite permease-like protein
MLKLSQRVVLALPILCFAASAQASAGPGVAEPSINPFWITPFVLLLASIALMPFIHKHWWEKNYPWVALALAAIAAAYYFLRAPSPHRWLHGMQEYVSFIVLLASLYVVSGGIVIGVGRRATPLMNCAVLLFGAVLANLFGTTGASMLLIRPFLRMNRGHIRPYHVVFFIFIVSNCGGLLTPIGDPPLFLGYLKGVPFWWVLQNVRFMWTVVVASLLALFLLIDTIDLGKTPRQAPDEAGPAVHILGVHNFLLIFGIIIAVFQPGVFEVGRSWRIAVSREVLMVASAVASLMMTGRQIHEKNEFSWGPIKEVAILFIGIFSTMVPALQWLGENAGKTPVKTPAHFYFASGVLSSVLDNAPTYLTFLEIQLAKINPEHVALARRELKKMESDDLRIDPTLPPEVKHALSAMLRYHLSDVREGKVRDDELNVAFLLGDPRQAMFIIAISLGSVLFGACTYIGNGPNFMVKSIADAAGVRTPTFGGYVLKFTLPVLIPIYVLVWFIFLRG